MANEIQSEEQRRADYAKVVARAWNDEAFKAKLMSDPHAALAEHGVEVPAGTTVKVVENTKDTLHLVLPPAPEGALSEEDLEKVAGGGSWTLSSCACGVAHE